MKPSERLAKTAMAIGSLTYLTRDAMLARPDDFAQIQVPEMMHQVCEFSRASIDPDKRTIELSFSSETREVRRWFGIEILGHDEGEINLDRLNSGRAPLCVDHNIHSVTEGQIGTVVRAWVKDKRGYAVVRFGKGELAASIMARVEDGELQSVSVGYRPEKMRLVEEVEDGPNVYRVVDWLPHEISIVASPGDTSVGIGRDTQAERTRSVPVIPKLETKEETMPEKIEERSGTPAANPAPEATTPAAPAVPAEARGVVPANPEDRGRAAHDARNEERVRIATIQAIAEEFQIAGDTVRSAITEGVSIDAFRQTVLDDLKTRQVDPTAPSQGNLIGLSPREIDRFSFLNLVRSQLFPNDRQIQERSAFEIDVCNAAAQAYTGRAQGMVVPFDVLSHRPSLDSEYGRQVAFNARSQRAMTVGTAAEAGNLVATNLAPSFIDILYNRMMVARLGATIFNNLTGNIDFKKFTAGATGYWVAEGSDVTESTPATALISLSPETVGGFVELTRRTILQASLDIEAWVRNNLAMAIALQIDVKALHGDGTSNTPTGIASTNGIGAVVHGTDGGAPTWATVVEFETEVAQDNADIGTLAYLVNAQTRGKLKTTEKASSTAQFLMGDSMTPDGMNTLNGYRCGVSQQVASGLSKGASSGILSGMFFGNWSDLYLGFWSGVDVLANPYTNDKSGTVRITGLQDVDLSVARAESFAYSADVNPA